MSATVTDQITVGALLRRQVRAALDAADIRYREHKGLLYSIFVVTATADQWQQIVAWGRKVSS